MLKELAKNSPETLFFGSLIGLCALVFTVAIAADAAVKIFAPVCQ